jgi:hypothetical protein
MNSQPEARAQFGEQLKQVIAIGFVAGNVLAFTLGWPGSGGTVMLLCPSPQRVQARKKNDIYGREETIG